MCCIIFFLTNAWAAEILVLSAESCAVGNCLSCSNQTSVLLNHKIMVNSNSGKIFSYRTVGFAQYVLSGFAGSFCQECK